MQPGETRALAFIATLQQRGFKNSDNILQIMDNGTFVNAEDMAPFIGMDRSFLLQDRTKRRKYGLTPVDLRMPKLGAPGADAVNYIRHDSDWVTADVTVTTDADQIPIAPGYEASQVVANGRRTVRFVTDSPILNFFSAQSARYAVSTRSLQGREHQRLLRPAASLERRPHPEGHGGRAGLLPGQLQPLSVPPGAGARVPGPARLVRRVVRQHHPVVRGHLLHRRRARSGEDRHGDLRRRPRARRTSGGRTR